MSKAEWLSWVQRLQAIAHNGLTYAATHFFTEDALPPLSTTRVTTAEIICFFEHHRCPELPADSD